MRKVILFLVVGLLIASASTPSFAQRLDGTLRGEVKDQTGAVVADAKVSVTNEATTVSLTTQTTSAGTYVFPSLTVGSYALKIEVKGFSTYLRKGIQVLSNQITEADAQLTVGAEMTTVEVTAGSEIIQTTSSQIGNTFGGNIMLSLPISTLGGSVLELATAFPNTTTQGGGVLGRGGSIGGTRPRTNGFSIDGVDNNDVGVTGPLVDPIEDAVAEFTLLTNQFSAEYGHSAGGQFNIVTKSGTNNWHGAAWEYNRNRNLNAMDNLEKGAGLTSPRRFDYNRAGADSGGPILKNRFFIFGAYEFQNRGRAATSPRVIAPTAAGLAQLNTLAANSAVTNVLAQFPTAPTADPTISPTFRTVNGTLIEMGFLQGAAPDFFNQHDFNVNADLNLAKHQLRWRWLYDRFRAPNINSALPQAQFTGAQTTDNRKFIMTDAWSVSSHIVNDFRLSYSRHTNAFGVPGAFSNFPNVEIDNLNLNVGPQGNSPQSSAQNVYQISDNMTFVKGPHTLKWGVEWRHWIAPSFFLPRARGEWDYGNLQTFINDLVPNCQNVTVACAPGLNGALRGAGDGSFAGNQNAVYLFAQDDLKLTPTLTLNLGLRYERSENARDAAKQGLNSIATLPGVFDFHVPKNDKDDIAPRVGFAWDPTGTGKWSVRSGFGIAYDVTFQNLTLLQLPPQLQTEQNPSLTCSGAAGPPPAWCPSGSGFLAGGGLAQVNVPPTTQAAARSATQGLIVDTVSPKILTWSLGVQHELLQNSSVEVRYVGTRSLELPVQVRANSITVFESNPNLVLPTFLNPSQVPATVASTAPTRAQFLAAEGLRFAAQGFDGGFVTAFPAIGSGIYHSGAVDFTHRFHRGLFLRTNYTFAKNIDNSTNELFSSRVNPRRPQAANDLASERARSVLDIRHKFALSWVYDLPKVSVDSAALKKILHGWQFNGTYLAQAGQPVTALSGVDANGDLDSAGDRAILNPNGVGLTGSGVNFICRNPTTGATSSSPTIGGVSSTGVVTGCGFAGQPFGTSGNVNIVGYVAQNPTATFVVAQAGSKSTVGRNTISSPGLNIWNLSVFKNTYFGETKNVQFRFEVFNPFNHRNFSLGLPSVFGDNTNALSTSYANVSSAQFLNAQQFNGGSRTIQLGLKVMF